MIVFVAWYYDEYEETAYVLGVYSSIDEGEVALAAARIPGDIHPILEAFDMNAVIKKPERWS